MRYFIALCLSTIIFNTSFSQFTHQDTLRGSNTVQRRWWNVLRYDVAVEPDYLSKTIKGSNVIEFESSNYPVNPVMQIDLQEPMNVDSIVMSDRFKPKYKREGNVYYVELKKMHTRVVKLSMTIYFSGKPREAVRAPWDGGWVWTHDEKGRPWMTVACQGLGASVWYPCKDYQGDEPDNGATLTVTVPDSLVAVGNGRLKNKSGNNNQTTSWTWEVKNPINSYNIVPYIGAYVNWTDTYHGLKGDLDCSYWVIDYNLDKSKKQFGRDVPLMLHCFEDWFGPYPFYEDSYKLVDAPHLGMEHQSAVAYGNEYRNGYLGMDRSSTGWGTKWDYIVVHESGHEWFANNITTVDIADMWVHEGFTTYSESLFVECQWGKKAADEYTQGLRRQTENIEPIIGRYGVNKEGSTDMYDKGSNLLHMTRQIIDNDSLFKEILRGLNRDYYHKIVTSAQVEKYIITKSKKNLGKVFDQYLRNTAIPTLQWRQSSGKIFFRWTDCISGFNMPLRIYRNDKAYWINPTREWQSIPAPANSTFAIDKNFYINTKKVQ